MAHNGARGQHEKDGRPGVFRCGNVRRCDGSRAASGNGERSGAYYPGPAELVPPRPAARALYGDRVWNGDRAPGGDRGWYGETAPYDELDPFLAGVQADGTVAARAAFGPAGRGAGGRWLLWPLRIVLWAALLVIVFRGLTAIVFDRAPAPAAGGAAAGKAAAAQFPVALAEAYATEFGRVYLGFSPQSQVQREQALEAFVPPSVSAADPNLGWNGVGQVNLQALQVAGDQGPGPAARRGHVARLDQRPAHGAGGAGGRRRRRPGSHRRARLAARAPADPAAGHDRPARPGQGGPRSAHE